MQFVDKTFHDVVKKIQDSSITEKEAMFVLFLPIAKLTANSALSKEFKKNGNSLVFKTKYGVVELRGRLLTEYHYKIVSSIIKNSKITLTDRGTAIAEFEEITIMRDVGLSPKAYTQLRKIVSEIADASYYFQVGADFKKRMEIFSEHVLPLKEKSKKKIQAVELHYEYFNMLKNDFPINFGNLYPLINSIKIPTIPTIIRYLYYAHREYGKTTFELRSILNSIHYPLNNTNSFKTITDRLNLYEEELYENFKIKYCILSNTFNMDEVKQLNLTNILLLGDSLSELSSYIGKIYRHDNKNYTIIEFKNVENSNKDWIILVKDFNNKDKTFNICMYLDDLLGYLKNCNSANYRII